MYYVLLWSPESTLLPLSNAFLCVQRSSLIQDFNFFLSDIVLNARQTHAIPTYYSHGTTMQATNNGPGEVPCGARRVRLTTPHPWNLWRRPTPGRTVSNDKSLSLLSNMSRKSNNTAIQIRIDNWTFSPVITAGPSNRRAAHLETT